MNADYINAERRLPAFTAAGKPVLESLIGVEADTWR
jgi:hypothetical protein